MDSTTHYQQEQLSFADLHLQQQSSDPIFDDPRWQNIYLPADTTPNFDWMHYRQPEDALSSSSSSDGSYYTHSVHSASSEGLNPLNYFQQQQQYQDPFGQATSTLPPSARHQQPEDANAWMYAHQHTNGAPPYTGAGTVDSYQRNSGDYDSSYSSGGEDQPQPLPHFSSPLAPSPHHHHPHQQQQDQYGQHQMYMFSDSTTGNTSGGGASPYGGTGHAKASDLYTSPPPPGNSSAYPTTADGRIPSGPPSGASYPSTYPSPSGQQQQRGPGGSRLTPVLSQLSIDPLTGYPPSSPLSPQSQQSQPSSQQQQQNGSSGNGGAAAASYSSPGPSRNHNRMMVPSTGGPYGRPAHQQRYPSGHQHSNSHSTNSSALSSTSSQQSHPQQQPPQQQSIFSPSGIAGGGKIFASNAVVLPPIDGSSPNSMSQQQQAAPPHLPHHVKPKREMVAGTPTHPDIPRPAVVNAPVPIPNLTKKSRGRQVPSVNGVTSGGAPAGSDPRDNHSRSRDRGGERSERGVRRSVGREKSWDPEVLESPLSPSGPQGGYFGAGPQWSDNEYDERAQNPLAHGHRSLFGQAGPMPTTPNHHHTHTHAHNNGGSTSSMSSPATSLSSRRTAEDGGPSYSNNPPAASSSEPAPAGPAPGTLEAELRSRPFVCTVEGCGKAYIRAEHLKRHVRSIHTNDKPYECPFVGCGREFSRYDNLCQHYKGVHGPTSSLSKEMARGK